MITHGINLLASGEALLVRDPSDRARNIIGAGASILQ